MMMMMMTRRPSSSDSVLPEETPHSLTGSGPPAQGKEMYVLVEGSATVSIKDKAGKAVEKNGRCRPPPSLRPPENLLPCSCATPCEGVSAGGFCALGQ